MAFSHPGVDGIIFRDFWDGSMQYPEAALCEGAGFEVRNVFEYLKFTANHCFD